MTRYNKGDKFVFAGTQTSAYLLADAQRDRHKLPMLTVNHWNIPVMNKCTGMKSILGIALVPGTTKELVDGMLQFDGVTTPENCGTVELRVCVQMRYDSLEASGGLEVTYA